MDVWIDVLRSLGRRHRLLPEIRSIIKVDGIWFLSDFCADFVFMDKSTNIDEVFVWLP